MQNLRLILLGCHWLQSPPPPHHTWWLVSSALHDRLLWIADVINRPGIQSYYITCGSSCYRKPRRLLLTQTVMATGRPDSIDASVRVVTLYQYKVFPTLCEATCSVLAVGPLLSGADARVAQPVAVSISGWVDPLAWAVGTNVLEHDSTDNAEGYSLVVFTLT